MVYQNQGIILLRLVQQKLAINIDKLYQYNMTNNINIT